MYTVVVCGSRTWDDETIIRGRISELLHEHDRDLHIIEGGAPGADTIAGKVTDSFKLVHTKVPAQWGRHGKHAGPIRNQFMLDLFDVDEVIAFRKDGKSNGTDDMVARAKKQGVPVTVWRMP